MGNKHCCQACGLNYETYMDLLAACKALMALKYLIDCAISYISQSNKLEKTIKALEQAIAKAEKNLEKIPENS